MFAHLYGTSNWGQSSSDLSDGSWFVSGSDDYTLKLWQETTAKVWSRTAGKCLDTYTGHSSSVLAVTISSDGRYIVSCAEDEIKIWNVKTQECIRTIYNKPCGGLQIRGAIGLTSGQIESLKALGAVDD